MSSQTIEIDNNVTDSVVDAVENVVVSETTNVV